MVLSSARDSVDGVFVFLRCGSVIGVLLDLRYRFSMPPYHWCNAFRDVRLIAAAGFSGIPGFPPEEGVGPQEFL